MTKRGALLGFTVILWSCPALAGFEYMPGAQSRGYAQQPVAPQSIGMSAEPTINRMPMIPTEPVSAEPLAPPSTDRVLANPVSRVQAPIRRARTQQTAMRPPANQPFDSEAVLDAAILGEPLEVAAQPAPASMPAPGEEYIAINPYPLQSEGGIATHSDARDQGAMDQVMMEDSGLLRPVAIPGSKRLAALQRARPQTPLVDEEAAFEEASAFGTVEEVALAPPPRKPNVPSLMDSPVPVNTDYTEAVGFGRDLPLALALSQVVPSGYTYSFAQNVDAGATVSWEGGKPWNEVLNEMLAPSGMRAVVRSNQVTIENV